VQGSIEGELREEVARLRDYVRRQGVELGEVDSQRDADNVVALALAQAERGELPVDLVQKAHVHARQNERVEFLTVLRQLTSGISSSISATEWLSLSRDATNLELPDQVRLALLERAIELRPRDRYYRRYQLEALAHSESPVQREKAREALLEHLGIIISDGKVSLPARMAPADITTAAVMLDAYHRDDLDEVALKITSAFLEAHPDNAVVLRNHARALRAAGEVEAARDCYRRALLNKDADGTTAGWFGSILSSSDHVDSAEVFLYGCQLEPQMAVNFAQAADELADALHMREIGRREGRALPDEIDNSTIERLLVCAFSCQIIDAQVIELTGSAVDTAELDPGFPDLLMALRRGNLTGPGDEIRLFTVRERVAIVKEIYSYVASDLTPGMI
jgi:tetratricopeptide (TPR) repeat protein